MKSLADDELISEFVTESREHLAAIEPDLLVMEQEDTQPDQEVINRVFRAIHSIKGGAGFFAFEAVKALSHVMESVLMQVRDRTLGVTPVLMDTLFAALDRLRAMMDDIRGSDGIPYAEEVARLMALLEGCGAGGGGRVKAHTEGKHQGRQFELDMEAVRSVLRRGMVLYHAKAFLHQDVDEHWDSPLAFLKNAMSVGQCLNAFLDMSSIGNLDDCLEQDLCVTVLFATVLEPDLVAHALRLPMEQIEPLDLQALKASLPPEPAPPVQTREAGPGFGQSQPPPESVPGAPTKGKGAAEAGADTLRVKVGLLGKLMNLAGEMVLGRNQLLRTMSPHAQSFPGLPDILQNINQVTTELQEAVMQTRMQPVGTLFNRLPRVVRDLAKLLGKQIEVEVRGADVELDKNLLELLADPLTHIIRNCADHAIEKPLDRAAAGKAQTGQILLNAYHEGGQVNITVQDDGRGIDAGQVARKAVAKGLITQAQADGMLPRERVNLVFAPGFSMAEQVSETSGRGVGMDVVRTNVEKLGGMVTLETEVGRGTTVHLRLPLTLAILPSMIVGLQGQRFAIPQVDVVELVWVKAEDVKSRIERVQGAEVLRLRDKLLPLVRLADVLGITRRFEDPGSGERLPDRRVIVADRRSAGAPSSEDEAWERQEADRRQSWHTDYHVVVLQLGSHLFGIIVDELHDFEEIVVKPLSRFLDNLTCYAGTTILGDGRVILILDAAGLAATAHLQFADLVAEEQRRRDEERQRRQLRLARQRSIILFEAGRGERFAVRQDQVLRLEQISAEAIERMGDREYIAYRGDSLPLVRLDQIMAVSPLRPESETFYLVIPAGAGGQDAPLGGLLVTTIIDALDVEIELKPTQILGPGLLGSAMLQGHMTMFLDLVEAVRAVAGGLKA